MASPATPTDVVMWMAPVITSALTPLILGVLNAIFTYLGVHVGKKPLGGIKRDQWTPVIALAVAVGLAWVCVPGAPWEKLAVGFASGYGASGFHKWRATRRKSSARAAPVHVEPGV